ncbi:RDD family protein [Wenzhouxiangella sp. XN79A]|uniref:RDD family protein n=1 Tax=Wenzhouxiangella sp. XN79A TaxID=2724193 RepID=UPI00144AB96C|nr:RDD family protein [Wenzhouxiangella sp. XN79A]NKI35056.1 RDD family protein [Wenzhouxiangella sp. XN79A]
MSEFDPRPCPLSRRLFALIYDGLILAGLWMIAAALVVIPTGDAVDSGQLGFQLFLVLVAFAYFGGCWRMGRQTVGMRAWKIRLDAPTSPPAFAALATRFAVGMVSIAALGAGFWSALFRADGATWHDRASGTRLVLITDQPRRSSA